MARYQIIFSYDGTQFVGSQRQAKSRTVQGELEKALHKLGWQGESILLAGRTDTGVHASGQVAAVDFDWAHSPESLQNALNAILPRDMAAQSVRIAPERFHPRYDAIFRRYIYRIYSQPVRDPLRDRYAWRVWPSVNGDAIQVAASELIGKHDFALFGTPPRPGGSTVRTVISAEWRACSDEWIFEVCADAFLYRMVRRMVFIQVAVGQGKLQIEPLRRSLCGEGVLPAGLALPAGLTLVEVSYPSLDVLAS